MRSVFLLLPALAILTSCSTPPRPPGVNDANRRAANDAAQVNLQICRGELHNSRILMTEKIREAVALRIAAGQQDLSGQALPPYGKPAEDTRSVTYTVLFSTGNTQVGAPPALVTQLVRDAATAPFILLSGRMDGFVENAADSRIARERAEAVRALLVSGGVSPSKIRTTWQTIGDHAADNTSPAGRMLNRRVEIEIYRVAPRMAPVPQG